jgi:DNA-binding transcriptional ArsR family regulator
VGVSSPWQALADPNRRAVLALLLERPRPVGELVAHLGLSQPGTSKHLRVLREAGLVVDTADGHERVYRLDIEPLAEVDAWLAPFRTGWGARLDALETEVHRTRRDRRAAGGQAADPDAEERTA